jgi:hypothetical protein
MSVGYWRWEASTRPRGGAYSTSRRRSYRREGYPIRANPSPAPAPAAQGGTHRLDVPPEQPGPRHAQPASPAAVQSAVEVQGCAVAHEMPGEEEKQLPATSLSQRHPTPEGQGGIDGRSLHWPKKTHSVQGE